MKLPCLSFHQPYASLVVNGLKTIENRSWTIDREGVFLVHASKKKDWALYKQVRARAKELGIPYDQFPDFEAIDYGGIVGATAVVGIIEPKAEEDGWHMAGFYGHQLSPDTCALSFRKLKGLQKFWFVELAGDEEFRLRAAGLLEATDGKP